MTDKKMNDVKWNRFEEEEGISLAPSMDIFPQVVAYVEQVLEENGIGMKLAYKINVAVDEIYSNIAQYSRASWSRVICKIDEESIVVRFMDNGRPYNLLEAKEPDLSLSLEERELGGLGIFLTRKLMDQVLYSYEDGCNIVDILLKR